MIRLLNLWQTLLPEFSWLVGGKFCNSPPLESVPTARHIMACPLSAPTAELVHTTLQTKDQPRSGRSPVSGHLVDPPGSPAHPLGRTSSLVHGSSVGDGSLHLRQSLSKFQNFFPRGQEDGTCNFVMLTRMILRVIIGVVTRSWLPKNSRICLGLLVPQPV